MNLALIKWARGCTREEFVVQCEIPYIYIYINQAKLRLGIASAGKRGRRPSTGWPSNKNGAGFFRNLEACGIHKIWRLGAVEQRCLFATASVKNFDLGFDRGKCRKREFKMMSQQQTQHRWLHLESTGTAKLRRLTRAQAAFCGRPGCAKSTANSQCDSCGFYHYLLEDTTTVSFPLQVLPSSLPFCMDRLIEWTFGNC